MSKIGHGVADQSLEVLVAPVLVLKNGVFTRLLTTPLREVLARQENVEIRTCLTNKDVLNRCPKMTRISAVPELEMFL
jgi:hypothetical protein